MNLSKPPKSNPFPECEKCDDLSCCPEPDISMDGFGSPLPPDCCPKPIKIMASTFKNHCHIDKLIREN
jgi:hypothetical protein